VFFPLCGITPVSAKDADFGGKMLALSTNISRAWEWMRDHWFISLLGCAYAVTTLVAIWKNANGYLLARSRSRPEVATRSKALVGAVWVLAIVVASWLSGLKGLVPLLGDSVFIAFAAFVCLEWYVWWEAPTWVGKVTEILVILLLWWLAYLISLALPKTWGWPIVVLTVGCSLLMLARRWRVSNLKQVFAQRLVVNFAITATAACLLMPAKMWPAIPVWLLTFVFGSALACLAPIIGGVWLMLPEWAANVVAPLWFLICTVLNKFGVPYMGG